jgi:hypothetical protein
VDASDLGKISPFGRNDKFVLPVRSLIFARDILTFSYCFAAQSFWSIIADQAQGVSSIDLFSSLG